MKNRSIIVSLHDSIKETITNIVKIVSQKHCPGQLFQSQKQPHIFQLYCTEQQQQLIQSELDAIMMPINKAYERACTDALMALS